MPNHIKNRLIILGSKDQVKKVIDSFGTHHPAKLSRAYCGDIICKKSEKDRMRFGWFNERTGIFQQRDEEDVLGLPDGWEFETEEAFCHFPDFEKIIPPPKNIFRGDLGEAERVMCDNEGRPNWYDWNRENWGTKWNCYNCKKQDDNIYTFETAWNGVPNLIEALSKMMPKIEFIYEYSDENVGYNVGSYTMKNGITKKSVPEEGSKEAYDLSFKLRPDYREYYVLVDGEYEPKD